MAILVRQDRSSSSTEFGLSSGGRVYQNRSPVTPQGMTTPSVGHFVILPSEGGMTMLIKSVAFKELMLPSDAHCKAVDAPLSETLEKIKNVLDKVTQNIFVLPGELAFSNSTSVIVKKSP